MKRILIIILTLSLFFFNSAQARTVCHYKVTTITENNQIKGHREEKNCEETKITGNKIGFMESFISSPQYETTLVFILGLALEAM